MVNEDETSLTRQKQSSVNFKVVQVLTGILYTWLIIVHLVGITFFAKGFLLTRLVLDDRSECQVLPNGTRTTSSTGCWHPKQFEKAVIILIDALRYDFTVPFQPDDAQSRPGHYHDALPFMYNTAVSRPENAFLLPFIADPPTTTLQRLKGLTTGSLPTFIEAGTNFAGSAIDEDNLITQFRTSGLRTVHVGDDTWHALFPEHFDSNLSRAYDSFNVPDLHSVDNGVIEHVFPYIESSISSQWDILIGHCLGVDHVGHRFGPDHPAMREKLNQMDRMIQNLTQAIDDRTLLVVMGDHGMDSQGNHGGESDEEVEAALWMYSRTPRFGRSSPGNAPPATAKERPIRQIDLVPTLALLLGVPIPFNNLGSPIEEAFSGPGQPSWNNLANVNLLNFDQIQKYQQQYSSKKALEASSQQLEAQKSISTLLQDTRSPDGRLIYQTVKLWQMETLSMYRRLWANFNIVDMTHGIELSAFSLLVLLLLSRATMSDVANSLPQLLRRLGFGLAFSIWTGPVLQFLFPEHFSIISGMAYGTVVGTYVASCDFFWHVRKSIRIPMPSSFWSWICVVFTLTQAAGFAANSFTIYEDTISLFFLTTFGVFAVASSLRQASRADRILGTYHSILFILQTRLASYSKLCREETMPGCRSTFYTGSNNSDALLHLAIPYTISLLLPELIKAFYKSTASFEGSAGFWIGFAFRMGLLCIAIVWTAEAAENGRWLENRISDSNLRNIRLGFAWTALAIAIPVGGATFIWAKPCINLLLRDKQTSSSSSEPGLKSDPNRPQLTILGYANTYGARYALLLPIIVLCTSLTLPPMGQMSIAICIWQIFSLLEILDTNGLNPPPTSTSTHQSPKSYTIGPIILAILGSFHFFKTGHAATLASIQWSSPFIALPTLTYPWAPLLLLLNTLGPQILCAAAVPLTVLWKRPVKTGDGSGRNGIWNQCLTAMLTHILYYAVMALATTLWAGHLRRHLMLYRVFMPRYLMAQMVLVVVDLVMLLLCLGSVRVVGVSVGDVFGY